MRAWLVAIVTISTLALQLPAFAADDADALYQQGKEQYAAGKLVEAEATFERAWALRQSYDIAGQLGAVQLELDKYAAAANSLAFAFDHWAPSGNPAGKASIAARLEQALKHVGRVVVSADPSTAVIQLDGNTIEPGRHHLDPGPHTFTATLDGYRTATNTVDVRQGTEHALTLRPERVTSTTTPNAGLSGYAIGAIITGVATLAWVGIGVGLHVAAAGEQDDANALEAQHQNAGDCSAAAPCGDIFDAFQTADGLYDASVGMFVAGSVTFVATGVLVALALTTPEQTSTRIQPLVSPTFGGALLIHSF